MPCYTYECTECDFLFEQFYLISDIDKPLNEPCPNCGIEKNIRRNIQSPRISFEGKYNAFQRAGNGWKEVQQKIKAASGRSNTIRTK
jgi:putative FmdB family regulatory protein